MMGGVGGGWGDLKSAMRPRDLFMGLRGSIGGLPGGPRGSRGHPRDAMGP